MTRPVYLDNASSTRIRDEALAEMIPYWMETYGNPSGVHSFSRAARSGVDAARKRIADALSCRPAEICFTSGGTESDNLAIRSAVVAYREKNGAIPHVISSPAEHHAVLNTLRACEKEGAARITLLHVDRYGRIDPEELENAIGPDTALVSIMTANNETGNLNPAAEIGAVCRRHGVPFHTDAVQAFGHMKLNAEETGADLISVSSHKIHGPKGAGALYFRTPGVLRPRLFGGMQENAKRPGTENVPALVGFGKAAECAILESDEVSKRVRSLRDSLISRILSEVPDVSVNTDTGNSVPHIANLTFHGADGKALLLLLDQSGIAASAGAACAAGSPEPSHVLLAQGLSRQDAYSSVRFSLSRYTTENEIDRVVRILPGLIEQASR